MDSNQRGESRAGNRALHLFHELRNLRAVLRGSGKRFHVLRRDGAPKPQALPQALQPDSASPTLHLAMFSLTRQEQVLIILVLLSLLIGAAVKHYRRVYNETHPAPAPTPTPSLRSKDLYYTPR
jgi:hypothetical protein